MAQGCTAAARDTRRVCALALAGMGRRASREASRRADLYVLGLLSQPLGPELGAQNRSPAAEPRARATAARSERRSMGSRPAKRERSCSDVGRARGNVGFAAR